MKRLWSPLLPLVLLCCCLSGIHSNRVYVHPFHLFAAKNVSCETLQTKPTKPVETVPVAPLDVAVVTPDARDLSTQDGQRQNNTERTAVLAELLNSLGLRIYQELSTKQQGANTLLSPVNTYGSLVTFYLGASKKTANSFQLLLGLSSGTDRDDCVFFVDGHTVLKTLQSIKSLVDDAPKNEISTQLWAFTRQDARLSEDFIQGTQDFSDASFIRGVDFSSTQQAEELVNSFVNKTSVEEVESIFKDLNPSTNLLYISSFNFQGSWKTTAQPPKTSLQEFHVDETTTVMAPVMTHTGVFYHLYDKLRRCTIVRLSLSKQTYMLLVLPHQGVSLNDIESKLLTDVISGWHHGLREGVLTLSVPKFSMSSTSDLRDLLTNLDPEIEAKLLGSLAEFNRLSSTEPFTIDKAYNKVLFELSGEEGELPKNQEIPSGALELSINRPFLFFVVEGDSNAILIMGKITNPTL
ncbi:angiotensinogen [Genypterus blacodes]|uniref:angiotensinogen n=1 Tax=Genypterus blacodes TaxID=154954 RepID=UPI003F76E1CB